MEENKQDNLATAFICGAIGAAIVMFIWNNQWGKKNKPIEEMTKSELQKLLDRFVKQENYEMAAVVRDTIKKIE